MAQGFINKHFFNLLLFTLTFGILLYDAIGFDYTDEICALFLFILFGFYMVKVPGWPINKAFLTTILVFIFYFIYSVVIGCNTKAAIISDLLVQIKPYLAFFCVYSMAPTFNESQKKILRVVSVAFGVFLFGLALADPFAKTIRGVMEHESHFAAAVIASAFCYLLSSKFSTRDKIIYLLILSIGLFSTRSKFYGFFVLNVISLIYFNKPERFHFTKKSILLFTGMALLMAAAAWQKIDIYFVQGFNPDNDKDLIARFVLYSTCFEVFRDYVPFGSGFGTFATFYSGQYYSDVYVKYGIDGVWGISKDFYPFIADTFYPSLAQFGVAGVLLYVSFWVYVIRKSFRFFRVNSNIKFIFITLLIVCYFAIEGIADSTITTHRGFFIMMLMGYSLAAMKRGTLSR